jgi:hypothetical protein
MNKKPKHDVWAGEAGEEEEQEKKKYRTMKMRVM